MLLKRKYQTMSIADRRIERAKKELKRLADIEVKLALKNEFFNRIPIITVKSTEAIDLKQMGYKSETDYEHATDTLGKLNKLLWIFRLFSDRTTSVIVLDFFPKNVLSRLNI